MIGSKVRREQTLQRSPAPGWPRLRAAPTVKALIILGFGLLFLILLGVVAGSAIMVRKHRAAVADMENLSSAAATIENARMEAANAALLLQRYVVSGDETLLAEIRTSTSNAVRGLHDAAAQQAAQRDTGQAEIIGEIAKAGDMLAFSVEQIITLRQQGDTSGAAAILEAIVPRFREFRTTLGESAAHELEQVSALRDDANRAGDTAFWLLVGSGIGGGLIALVTALAVARAIIQPLAALGRTARDIGAGNLDARTEPSGPRELVQLGDTLNVMAARLQQREQDLSISYQELKARNRQLLEARAQAATDALTQLSNHRAFHEAIRREFKDTLENGGRIGVVMMDIDGFKAINDSLGHLQGDEILRQCARTFCEVVDASRIYRYGGDEFAVLLPDLGMEASSQVAERLRRATAESNGNGPNKITVSLGVSAFPGTAATAEELIYEADAAMYAAKSAGKNTVMQWGAAVTTRPGALLGSHGDARAQDVTIALLAALAAKDPATHAHSERCSTLAGQLAAELDLRLEDQALIRVAALLHDIGKLAVPDDVLFKRGALNKSEWAEMCQHPAAGHHLLSKIPPLAGAMLAVLHHHERFNGSGYPDGLAGTAIPLASRIILVADAYDAMTSDRPYRDAMSPEAAVAELTRHSGTQFDPAVVDAFLRVLGRATEPAPGASNGEHDSASAPAVRTP